MANDQRTAIDDLRARYRAAAALEQQLSGQESALARAFADESALAAAKVNAAQFGPPEEWAEMNYALPGEGINRGNEYAAKAGDVRQRRIAAHRERCDLEVEIANAELLAANPQSVGT